LSTIVVELYEAFRAAGVDDAKAKAAAGAVIAVESRQDLATKVDLANLKADLIKGNVGTLIAMTGLFAAIAKLL
jgi:hypothetical protein